MVKGVVVVVVTLKDEQLRSVSHYFLNMVTTKKKTWNLITKWKHCKVDFTVF